MKLHVRSSEVEGRVSAPPSKSYTHRALLAGAFSDSTRVLNPLDSADPRASAGAAEHLGADVDWRDSVVDVRGFDGSPETPDDVVDCGNSGTTLRLFTGAAALAPGTTVLTGDSSLRSRPNQPLLDALQQLEVDASSTRDNGQAPLVVEGGLSGGEASIDGSVSSQFVSSLLFAGAATEDGLSLEIEGKLRSRPYVDMTVEVMEMMEVEVEETMEGFHVAGGQRYRADEVRVPGDSSSASYPLAAGAVAGGRVTVENLYPGAQGDTVFVEVLERMGADVSWDRDAGVVDVGASSLSGVEFDAGDNPDLVPTVAVLGAVASGETRVVEAEHLRFKETDRLEATSTELGKMGVEVRETPDGLVVDGDASSLEGAEVDGRHDHRIVMALAVAALAAEGETVIDTLESVEVSYPGFVEDMKALGADVSTSG